ncbi:MAG: MFS transporter [Gammaproteobacteria bacterium]|nr:MFS transporter [Gammaproteobacteria bacterium]
MLTDINGKKILVITCCLLLLVLLNIDLTAVNIGVPSITSYFHATLHQGQLILSILNLTFALFLLPSTSFARFIGEKRLYIIGLGLFLVSACICGLAGSFFILVAGRILQGIAFAILFPLSITIPFKMIHASEKIILLGIVSFVAGASQSIGPLIGGIILHAMSWRYLFYLNVPFLMVMLICMAFMTISTDDVRDAKNSAISLVIYGVFAMSVYYAIFVIRISYLGVSIAGLLLAILVTAELRFVPAVFRFDLFKNVRFAVGCIVRSVIGYVWFGLPYLVSVYLQNVVHINTKVTGLLLTLLGVMYGIVSLTTGMFGRTRETRLMVFAFLQSIVVYLVFIVINGGFDLCWFIALLLSTGLLLGVAVPCLSNLVFSSVARDDITAASGIYYTLAAFSGAVGVKITNMIYTKEVCHLGSCGVITHNLKSQFAAVYYHHFRENIYYILLMLVFSLLLIIVCKLRVSKTDCM